MYNYKFQAILIQIIVAEIINDHITVQPLEKVRANHMIENSKFIVELVG